MRVKKQKVKKQVQRNTTLAEFSVHQAEADGTSKSEVARSDESIQAPEESRELEDTSRTGGSASVKVEVATEPVGVAHEEA